MNLRRMATRILDISPRKVLRAATRGIDRYTPLGEFRSTGAQLAELALMREDNSRADQPFVASSHWQKVIGIFEEYFRREGIGNPEEQDLNQRFSGFALGDARLHRYVCWMYRRSLQKRDSLNLLDTLNATCSDRLGFAYNMDNQKVSLDLLFSIDDFYNLYELNPAVATEPVVVAELGAGWGRLGYVLLKVNPKATYVVFDLPEVLLISQSYLPTLLPDLVARPYSQSRGIRFSRQSLATASLWFLGPQDMDQFQSCSVDYIVNIASFQEMPVEFVKEYLRRFSELAGNGCCYMRQLYDGKSTATIWARIDGLQAYPFPATGAENFFGQLRFPTNF